MKQRELEMKLQELAGFEDPKAELEQYSTPASIAADILYKAHAHGDIVGKRVLDLGTGPGIFAIGACLLGAEESTGTDIDHDIISIARSNVDKMGCQVDIHFCPVNSIQGKWDTCIMNPPFGSQTRHADLQFLDKALEVCEVTYSLHNSETLAFLRRRVEESGCIVDMEKAYEFRIPHMFDFHRKEKVNIPVTLLRIVRP